MELRKRHESIWPNDSEKKEQLKEQEKKCIVNLTEGKERKMLSRRGNEIPREGRFLDEIRLCRQMDILLSRDVMSMTGGRQASIDGKFMQYALSLSTKCNMAQGPRDAMARVISQDRYF